MNNQHSTLFAAYAKAQHARTLLTTLLAGTFVLAQVVPTYATIDNSATASGTFNSTTTTSPPSTQSVTVNNTPSLVVAKSASAPVDVNADGIINANDTITYQVTVTNNGQVTLTNVVPVDQGTKFGGTAGTGSFILNAGNIWTPTVGTLPVTLAPTQSKTYTAVYKLSAADADRGALAGSGGVVNTAVAQGNKPDASLFTAPTPATATQTITPTAGLTIVKAKALAKKPGNLSANAELGDTLTYTYTVTNSGNVAMTSVTVKDMHGSPAVQVGTGALVPGIVGDTLVSEGPMVVPASTDAGVNGIWDTLQPGAVVAFTWSHPVSQAEMDHG